MEAGGHDGERRAGVERGAARIPVSTYRLQLAPGFGFSEAGGVAPYLRALGVSHVYASPVFAAGPDSPHGYDITSHEALGPRLGGKIGWRELVRELARLGLGIVLDFVPNHMGVDEPQANRWWWDVLENGVCSPFARFFDIDWDPVKPELRGRLLLPVLGDQYGRVLERGELRLEYGDGELRVCYFERTFPVNPRRAPMVLGHDLATLQAHLDPADPDLRELLSILTALGNLPSILETEPDRVAERQREKEVARSRLDRLAMRSSRIREHIEASVRHFNGQPGRPETFRALHELLEQQAYRLAYWRTAFHEINYRRFFDINGLACLRMEDPEVFERTHPLLLQLLAGGAIDGVRLDHVDGLYDPRAYLERLAEAVRKARAERAGTEAVPAVTAGGGPACYVVAEKVLSRGEELPLEWALHGTTGYDFLNDVHRLFVDARGRAPLQRLFRRFTRRQSGFEDVVYHSKKTVMQSTLASELNMLAHALNGISEGDPKSRDFTLNSLHDMLLEVVACFPVYRTYISDSSRKEDARVLRAALARARRRNPAMDASIFAFLESVLLEQRPGGPGDEERDRRRTFAMKFQQYTGPVQAKGLEDTAFYRHHVLLSLNDVGGGPEVFALDPDEFHARNRRRREHWPHAMLCTSTHDTKRGEDARVRLDVLSEIPEEWAGAVSRWARLNAANRTRVEDEWAPDRGDEYLFYQALLGAWPAGEPDLPALAERLSGYMTKAIREAKLHTSWINENPPYQQAVADFVAGALTGRRAPAFLESFAPLARRVARLGALNSLAQTLLKIAAPGVPDFYQGSELWDLSLVDPDNRRPVDFERRRALLERLEPLLAGEAPPEERAARAHALLRDWEDGAVKLWVTACGLRLRRARAALFLDGDYVPLAPEGERAAHVVAFARTLGPAVAVAVVPRLMARLAGEEPPLGEAAWGDTAVRLPAELARRPLRHGLTGAELRPRETPGGEGSLPLAEVLRDFPVALLTTDPE